MIPNVNMTPPPPPHSLPHVQTPANQVSPVVAKQQDQDQGQDVPGSCLEEDLSESASESEGRKKGPIKFGPRKAGDCVEEGFTGTRRGFDLIKVHFLLTALLV